MSMSAATAMAARLTAPFGRGADNLTLVLDPTDDPGTAHIAPYDFNRHEALYELAPQPRYVITALAELQAEVTLTVGYETTPLADANAAATSSAVVKVAAGAIAGTSVLLDLGTDEGPRVRLTSLTMSPAPAAGKRGETLWRITALLGNLAKLLWAAGAERDLLRRQAALILQQKTLAEATGGSLDLIGYGLGVPRFPPLNHDVDGDTVALYALDDPPGSTTVVDTTSLHGVPGHPGVTRGAVTGGVPGRFRTGFAFPGGAAELSVASHADFDTPADRSLTVEAFVRPAGTTPGDIVRKCANPETAGAGWSLGVGAFGRGIDNNVRLTLGDGRRRLALFADRALPLGRFSHVAGVVDRPLGEARLLIDGEVTARLALGEAEGPDHAGPLGALTNGEPLRIGTGFAGVMDEIRISRIARADFAPVLGEADASYRQRLAVFRRWTLPTPARLQEMLNAAVGEIGGQEDPIVVAGADATVFGRSVDIRALPQTLAPRDSVNAAGERGARETDSVGTPANDAGFDVRLLASHANAPGLGFDPAHAGTLAPGEPPPDNHRMQARLLDPLDDLVAQASATAPAGSSLMVASGFTPQAEDLRAVGRGLHLRHTALDAGRLAALAHAAGFDFVRRLPVGDRVYVAMAPGAPVAIRPKEPAAPKLGGDLREGDTLDFTAEPTPSLGLTYAWSIVPCGQGRLVFTSATTTGPVVTVRATAPGLVTLRCEIAVKGATYATARELRVMPADLDDGATIGADGARGVAADIAEEADAVFHPALLITFDDAAITAADLGARRMQAPLVTRLQRLLGFLAAQAPGTKLALQQGYLADAPDLRGVGRQLTVSHATVGAGLLAAMAHAAGFTHVERHGSTVIVRQRPEAPLTVSGAGDALAEGTPLTLAVAPRAGTAAVLSHGETVYAANAASDTVSEIDAAFGKVRRAFKVGWGPCSLALSADGKRLFTADRLGGTVSAIDLAGGTVTSVAVGAEPVAVAHHPARPSLYVACRGAKTVVEMDSPALAIRATANVAGGAPSCLAFQPNGAALWVGADDGALRRATLSPLALGAPLQLPGAPASLAIAGDGARLYAACPMPGEMTGRLCIIDAAASTLLAASEISARPGLVATGTDGRLMMVDVAPGAERLHLLTASAGAPFVASTANVRLRGAPSGMAAEPARVYVTSQRDDLVSVVATAPVLGIEASWRLGTGLGERLSWALRAGRTTGLTLSSTSTPTVTVTSPGSGLSTARANYMTQDGGEPYTFDVRLDTPRVPQTATISRRQYELIMNIISAFVPIGVEARTRAIRDRVEGLGAGQTSEAPIYTFPNFRVRAPTPRRISRE